MGLFIAVVSLCLALTMILARIERNARFVGAVQGVSAARDYQGLVLDSTGLAGLLIGLVEKTADVSVVELSLKRPTGQSFDRHFSIDSTKYWNVWPLRLAVKSELDTYGVEAVILIPISSMYTGFAISLSLSFIVAALAVVLLELRKRREQVIVATKIQEVALQIAHDIRSPLAALNAIMTGSTGIPEDERLILRSVVNRVTDIANNLLTRNAIQDSQVDSLVTTPCLILSHVEAIVSEKRSQYRALVGLTLDLITAPGFYGSFANLESADFKRILSNLIDNSVQATSGNGNIHVILQKSMTDVTIKIQDDGIGISQEIIPKLMQKGASFGKSGGSGLGLFHARKFAEASSGKVDIKSTQGSGTLISLSFPRVQSPQWFADELVLAQGTTLVILDDDPSVHQIWKVKLQSLNLERSDLKIVAFTESEQFYVWRETQSDSDLSSSVFLIDYDIVGSSSNGLDILSELPRENAGRFLVSSHFEEKTVQSRCENLGVRQIPKSMTPFIPVKFVGKLPEVVT